MSALNTFPDKVIRFVELSGVHAQRIANELTQKEAAEKRASALVPALVTKMLAAGVIEQQEKDAAASALTDHARTLEILDNAIEKLAEKSKGNAKQAGSLGHGVDADPVTTPPSSSSVIMGLRTSEKKASDLAYEAGLGVSLPRN